MELTYPIISFNAWPVFIAWSVDHRVDQFNRLDLIPSRLPSRRGQKHDEPKAKKDEFFSIMEKRLKEIDRKIHELAYRVKELEARKKCLSE